MMARPRPELAARACRHQSTGAAVHSDRVNTPATVLPGGISASITSSLPRQRIPAAATASRTPATVCSVGNAAGARGETLVPDISASAT